MNRQLETERMPTLKSSLIALAVTVSYALGLGLFMVFGYLVLVLSAPGVGDVHKWALSFNYICSAALVYGIASTSLLFLVSLVKDPIAGFAFAVPLGLLGAAASTCLSAPLVIVA